MAKPGSNDHAAAIAARAALEAGLTRLGIAIVTHVASRGLDWQNDTEIQGEIARPDGRPYHRESIGRKRREIARAGLILSRRVYAGFRPPGAKWRSKAGTTLKSVVWPALKLARPTLRGERQAQRYRARLAQGETTPRPLGEVMTPAEVHAGGLAVLRMLDGPPPRR